MWGRNRLSSSSCRDSTRPVVVYRSTRETPRGSLRSLALPTKTAFCWRTSGTRRLASGSWILREPWRAHGVSATSASHAEARSTSSGSLDPSEPRRRPAQWHAGSSTSVVSCAKSTSSKCSVPKSPGERRAVTPSCDGAKRSMQVISNVRSRTACPGLGMEKVRRSTTICEPRHSVCRRLQRSVSASTPTSPSAMQRIESDGVRTRLSLTATTDLPSRRAARPSMTIVTSLVMRWRTASAPRVEEAVAVGEAEYVGAGLGGASCDPGAAGAGGPHAIMQRRSDGPVTSRALMGHSRRRPRPRGGDDATPVWSPWPARPPLRRRATG